MMINRDANVLWQTIPYGPESLGLHCHPIAVTSFVETRKTKYVSRLMAKPTMWFCAQRRLRSAWASTAQSDQSLRCPHEESLGPKLPTERTAKTLIRLGGCPQRRLLSDWADAKTDLSLCWAHSHFVGFVMRRLRCGR